MKKIKLVLFATLIAALFTACGDKKDKAATDEKAKVEEVAKASGNVLIEKYQAVSDKMVELYKKGLTGDTEALQEYQKVAEEFANFMQENQEAWSKLTAEEIQKIQDIGTKAAEAMTQQ